MHSMLFILEKKNQFTLKMFKDRIRIMTSTVQFQNQVLHKYIFYLDLHAIKRGAERWLNGLNTCQEWPLTTESCISPEYQWCNISQIKWNRQFKIIQSHVLFYTICLKLKYLLLEKCEIQYLLSSMFNVCNCRISSVEVDFSRLHCKCKDLSLHFLGTSHPVPPLQNFWSKSVRILPCKEVLSLFRGRINCF